jgi:hypothetical protein
MLFFWLCGVKGLAFAGKVGNEGVTAFPLVGGHGYRLDRGKNLIEDIGQEIDLLPIALGRKVAGEELSPYYVHGQTCQSAI